MAASLFLSQHLIRLAHVSGRHWHVRGATIRLRLHCAFLGAVSLGTEALRVTGQQQLYPRPAQGSRLRLYLVGSSATPDRASGVHIALVWLARPSLYSVNAGDARGRPFPSRLRRLPLGTS